MKKVNFPRLILSILLLAVVSTLISFAFSGDAFLYAGKIAASLTAVGFVKGLFNMSFKIKGALMSDGFVINDTTYAGEAASQFIVKAITGADTVAGGHVYIKDGIKKQFTIPRWDANYEDFIQDTQATPVSKGSFVVDGKALDPANYTIYTEFDPRAFEDQWFATQLNPTLIDRSLPYSAESVTVQEVLKRHAKYFNKSIWNNDKTLSTIYKYYNGFIKNASADGTVNVVGTPLTLTSSNIQGEMLRCYNLIPLALRYDPNMKYFCSYATWDLYAQSQINQTYKGIDTTQDGVPKFKGKEVVRIADFPDNRFFIAKGMATPESNLWVGMNSVADEGLQLSKLQANSSLWFIKMLMKVDVQIGWGVEVVLY
jgi:hypothetical protein